MKTLTLSIKQTFFDQILAGTKTIETRDIKSSNASKYVSFIDTATHMEYKNWMDIPDGVSDIQIQPVSYDALRLLTGAYKGTRPSCLVEVKDAEVIFLVDENEEQIYYDEKGLEFPAMCIDYFLGAVLEK
ncbi:MAG: ASCH domain-containing protein [Bacteroidales bacterium]